MKSACPGARALRTPEIELVPCPACGGRIEMFTDEVQAECVLCGRTVRRRIRSCVDWCIHAAECVGEEVYLKLKIDGREGL